MNRIHDNVSIDRIVKNHNLYGVDKDIFKKAYQLATKEPLIFFMIDLKSREPMDFYSHGFLNFLKLKEDQ